MFTAKAGYLSLAARISKVIGQQCANTARFCGYCKKLPQILGFSRAKGSSNISEGAHVASMVFMLERV